MSEKPEKFDAPKVICGVYDKEAANFLDDEVTAHSAETYAGAEVICGVYDKEAAN
ncbi:hypothetical protein ACFY00_23435 [Kitasatospora sp. NPDC001540]|uniref:hypothetical protein n=1 Tax=Kitasatospora sp. NPDC001540 TaxID=3364014 RepID=UPI00369ADCE0